MPTGTAFFGASDTTALTFSAPTTVGGWTFNTGAPAFTFSNSQSLEFNGAGIVVSGGSATINNNAGGILDFTNDSTAGSATIHNTRIVNFFSSSMGGSAAINNDGGALTFRDTSTAEGGAITNNNLGSLDFRNTSTAGNATITNNAAGTEVFFFDNSTAGNAAITNTSGAVVDFSLSTGPAGDHQLAAGSIAGAGSFELGANDLTVGGNNLSTDVSGVILGTGSLVKVGAGTLTLSGSASLGGTIIDGGTLAVSGGTLNIDAGIASTQILIVGQSGVGTLAVQNGGTVTDSGGFVGDFAGSRGTATVSGENSTWTNFDLVVGGLGGAGTLTIQDGGTVNSPGGGSIGMDPGSTSTVTVTGSGSIWNNGSKRRAQYRQFWHGHTDDRERRDGHQRQRLHH